MGNNDKPLGMSGGVPAGELLPCPNPWCERIEGVEASQHLATERWHVCCDDCMIEGPWAKTYDEAIAAWNTRSTPTPPIEGRDADVERVEVVARALCEYQIRQARRWDTDTDVLEAMLPAAITHGWPSFMPQARAALQALGERG